MSISPSAPEPKDSYVYEAASTPRWIFIVFIAAFALIGYVLYAGNDSRNKLENELAQSNSKQAAPAGGTFDLDLAAVGLSNPPANCEPEPCAA